MVNPSYNVDKSEEGEGNHLPRGRRGGPERIHKWLVKSLLPSIEKQGKKCRDPRERKRRMNRKPLPRSQLVS